MGRVRLAGSRQRGRIPARGSQQGPRRTGNRSGPRVRSLCMFLLVTGSLSAGDLHDRSAGRLGGRDDALRAPCWPTGSRRFQPAPPAVRRWAPPRPANRSGAPISSSRSRVAGPGARGTPSIRSGATIWTQGRSHRRRSRRDRAGPGRRLAAAGSLEAIVRFRNAGFIGRDWPSCVAVCNDSGYDDDRLIHSLVISRIRQGV